MNTGDRWRVIIGILLGIALIFLLDEARGADIPAPKATPPAVEISEQSFTVLGTDGDTLVVVPYLVPIVELRTEKFARIYKRNEKVRCQIRQLELHFNDAEDAATKERKPVKTYAITFACGEDTFELKAVHFR